MPSVYYTRVQRPATNECRRQNLGIDDTATCWEGCRLLAADSVAAACAAYRLMPIRATEWNPVLILFLNPPRCKIRRYEDTDTKVTKGELAGSR